MDLLASGRECDIYDAGPGLVLRRAKSGRAMDDEARLMTHLHEAGYPVPRIERAEGPDMVMERVDGPTMLDFMVRRPLRLSKWAAMLADLHRRLHALDAPDWLPDVGDGGRSVVHLDLHPLNVIMSRGGPVVIDWTNGRRGTEATDVCQTWVIMATSTIEGSRLERVVGAVGRKLFVRMFLGHFDMAAVRAQLPAVAENRKLDRNVRPDERDAIDRLLAG